MHIERLQIRNFRAIENLDLQELKSLVVVAGPNGCGKSCIFDALRLIKSLYGGYQQNEYLQWFGEFQIDVNSPEQNFSALFRSAHQPVEIAATFKLDRAEISYMREMSNELCAVIAWTERLNQESDTIGASPQIHAMKYPALVGEVGARTEQLQEQLLRDLESPQFDLACSISSPRARVEVTPCLTANLLFQVYRPQHLGIMDYYSAARTYAREGEGAVNLNLDAMEAQRKSYALYNWQSKYSNIKAELTSSYVAGLIRDQAGAADKEADSSRKALDDTLAEMFTLFFPNKTYMGVRPLPNGKLGFPVRLSTGQEHDLNDLSSGEKEVLYGYLRLHNQTPRNSVILLDEPELHLNPSLLRGFPQFYYRHLVRPTGNQLWMVTHSDTLLREAVTSNEFSVFHMQSATAIDDGANQAVPIGRATPLEPVLFDLVGDIAAYKPASRVIVFEGGGDTDFDVRMVSRLFPMLRDSANLISGGSKGRVKELYRVLAETAEQTGLGDRFFAITDSDSDGASEALKSDHVFSWDVYHIENYLLNPEYVLRAYRTVMLNPLLSDAKTCSDALLESARRILPQLVSRTFRESVNRALVGCINIKGDEHGASASCAMRPSIDASLARLVEQIRTIRGDDYLRELEESTREQLARHLADASWMERFPGRDILRRFVADYLDGVASYDGFTTAILTAMATDEYKPPGMKRVIDEVLRG